MNILDLVEEAGLTRSKGQGRSNEFHSPCPFCEGGRDRFVMWPFKSNPNGVVKGGRFWCRVCGRKGDAITFLKELYKMSYQDACKKLEISPGFNESCSKRDAQVVFKAIDPPEAWVNKAVAFDMWCQQKLNGSWVGNKLLRSRGISIETAEKFNLGYCPRQLYLEREDWGLAPEFRPDGRPKRLWMPPGLVIPLVSNNEDVLKIKIRRDDWIEGDALPKYVEVPGSKQCLSVYGDTSLSAALVLESELDAILVQQFATDLAFCIATGGASKNVDAETNRIIQRVQTVFFCPDSDEPGVKAWLRWKKLYPNSHKLLTPAGKAAGDAYQAGVDLREWIQEALSRI